MATAVAPYNRPDERFFVKALHGKLEEQVQEIKKDIGNSFALVFIDPTGWTGFSLDRLAPILNHDPGEVLLNFMYDFVNRAVSMSDPKTIASLDPILGGPGWQSRLDTSMRKGLAVEQLFRQELKKSGKFKWVISTAIERPDSDRDLFFIVYGTRHDKGLTTFRDIGYKALKSYEGHRALAKHDKKVTKTGQPSLFAPDALPQTTSISVDDFVDRQVAATREWILQQLRSRGRPISFGSLSLSAIEMFHVRETNVKDICVQLGTDGVIAAPWRTEGPRNKPKPQHLITLLSSAAKEKES